MPEAEQGVTEFKAKVMRHEGYSVDPDRPDDVKYQVADELGVPLSPGYNGDLSV